MADNAPPVNVQQVMHKTARTHHVLRENRKRHAESARRARKDVADTAQEGNSQQ